MDTAAPSEELAELAARHGVATDYWDWQGQHVRRRRRRDPGRPRARSASTRPTTTRSSRRSRRTTTCPGAVPSRRPWSPARAGRRGSPCTSRTGTGVRLDIELEDGTVRPATQVDWWVPPRWIDGREVGEATFELPGDLPAGLAPAARPRRRRDGRRPDGDVAPRRDPAAGSSCRRRCATGASWGLMEQLYQVRSADSWGIGDLGDLAELAAWAGRDLGADFVLVNPLHAAEPVRADGAVAVPADDPPVRQPAVPAGRGRARGPPASTPRPAAGSTALAAEARALNDGRHASTATPPGRPSGRPWGWSSARPDRARERRVPGVPATDEGEGLVDFATWCALAEEHGLPWTSLAATSCRTRSARGGGRSASGTPTEVDFHCWLQWLLDEQLAAVQRDARAAGMSLGVVHDLAVGVHPRRRRRVGAGRRAGPRGVPSGRRRTSSTSSARTGASRRGGPTGSPSSATRRSATWCAPSCATPAASGSTTSSGCSGCGGSRTGWTPDRGHLRALRPRGADRHPRARGAAGGRRRRRRGPRRRRAVGAGVPARARHPRHLDPVVRVGPRGDGGPLAPGALPRAVPVDGDHPRPAADRGLPRGWSTSRSGSGSAC